LSNEQRWKKKINAFYLFNTKSLILSQDLIYLIVSIKSDN
jgi:hypothetical protein